MDYWTGLLNISLILGATGDALPEAVLSTSSESEPELASSTQELTLAELAPVSNVIESIPAASYLGAPIPAETSLISDSAADLAIDRSSPETNQVVLEGTILGEHHPVAQTPSPIEPSIAPDPAAPLDISPEIIEESPVLQRWLQEVPDVLSEIRNDPSFRTRLRLGYSQFPDDEAGFNVGVEDLFLGRTGLTLSADYQATFDQEREAYGSDLRYYVRPLGSYINVAPVIGYRHLETEDYTTDGVNLGLRLLLALSRTGAADVSLSQSWVAPGTEEEVGITTLSFGYAFTPNLRLSTDLQRQNARQSKDSRLGIVLEWML